MDHEQAIRAGIRLNSQKRWHITLHRAFAEPSRRLHREACSGRRNKGAGLIYYRGVKAYTPLGH